MSQKIARRKVANYIAEQLATGADSKTIAQQATAYLIDTKQTKQVELLIRDIETALAARGTVAASVTSAYALDEPTRALITTFIKDAEHAESVVITSESIDPDLIGGVIVRSPNRVFDGSVRSQLKNLTAFSKEL